MPSIICVKLAQRKIDGHMIGEPTHHFNYFPFDRAYLIPPDAAPFVSRLFRAYMVMELTTSLHSALNSISFEKVFHDTIWRNFGPPQPGKPRGALKGICNNIEGWQVVVPTYLHNEYSVKNNKYVSATAQYVLSTAVGTDHNTKARLPRVALVTPHGTYPLMCVACARFPTQLAGECTFGTADCRQNCSFKFPVDPTQIKTSEEGQNHDRIQ